ncbi:MAG: hypothetical protein GX038_05040 [Erysipelothrix sp.]|nr:hypothetical protein [Erysipelothrix sp.]
MVDKLKKHTSTIGILIVFIAVVSIMVAREHLSNPVYGEMYVEKSFGDFDDTTLVIQYVSNIYDTRRIDKITFYDQHNNKYEATPMYDYNPQYTGLYRQYLEYVNMQMVSGSFDEYALITEGEVVYTNGDKQVVNFGEIHLYGTLNQMNYLNNVGMSSYIEGNMTSLNTANDEFELVSIESPLLTKFGDDYIFEINDESFDDADKRFHDGRTFDLSLTKQGEPLVERVEFLPKVTVRTSDGKERQFYIENLVSIHNFGTRQELRKYLKDRK